MKLREFNWHTLGCIGGKTVTESEGLFLPPHTSSEWVEFFINMSALLFFIIRRYEAIFQCQFIIYKQGENLHSLWA